MAKTDSSSEERHSRTTAFMPSRRRRGMKAKRLAIMLVILALALGLGVFAYKYDQANKEAKRLADPKAAAEQQVADLVSNVGKLVELPSGETPTIATVTDKSKLNSQAFFKNAANGDKVLIFTQAKRAVLYRPSTNKVIEVAPLNIGNSSQSSSAGTTTDKTTTTTSNKKDNP